VIALALHAQGVLLPVKAQPGASSNAVRGEHHGMLKVSVTSIAEKGKANKAIVAVLAKELQLRKSQIALARGEASSEKVFLIRECDLALLQQKVDWALPERNREAD
jgi:uncharacterized protein (TIGR00251 family)